MKIKSIALRIVLLRRKVRLYPVVSIITTCLISCFIEITAQETVLIFTHSYNRPDFIELQHKTLKKFLKDSYKFIVFNDAVDPSHEQAILNACRHLDIECVRIPQEIHTLPYLPRWPHEPPNYPTVRCVNNIQYSLNKFGFNHNGIVVILDSDLFLIRELSFIDFLQNHDILAGIQRHFPYGGNEMRWVDHFSVHCFALNMKTLPNRHSFNVNCGMINEIPVDAGGHTFLYLQNQPEVRVRHGRSYHIPNSNISLNALIDWGFNEQEIHFIKSKKDFPINVEFVFDNHFLHYRSGTNWDQRPAEYHQQKILQTQFFLNEVISKQAVKEYEDQKLELLQGFMNDLLL